MTTLENPTDRIKIQSTVLTRLITTSPDWFGLWIGDTPVSTIIYLKRADLRNLRDLLDKTDRETPEPEDHGKNAKQQHENERRSHD